MLCALQDFAQGAQGHLPTSWDRMTPSLLWCGRPKMGLMMRARRQTCVFNGQGQVCWLCKHLSLSGAGEGSLRKGTAKERQQEGHAAEKQGGQHKGRGKKST
eukprot:scaffold50500_cov18-Tisochrysis_lutea.AAC.1